MFTESQSSTYDLFSGKDEEQIKFMEELCVQIDYYDNVVGGITKKESHLMDNISKGILHRAFSVFLFNSKGDLLLQQRSNKKITFPNAFTNTCCSHPLYCEEELEETNAIGIKKAALRKLEHELGVAKNKLSVNDINFITRIHYKAASNDIWGEHEIDYILLVQKDVDLKLNLNEVNCCKYFSKEQLKEFLDTSDNNGVIITPWFRLIANTFLWNWWEDLEKTKRSPCDPAIHRMC
ncbi:isopentenyl-diphosphate Delta-isomerase 1-like [Zophobas morio]|jgi:isopentenyl-diphosphate delta-isomerase|uniref:isopentenyl-diphosphate Delta-isomerase 1-like n=1 Tax=Zophobas morio TaxID=2755281 RepID=UPI003083D351